MKIKILKRYLWGGKIYIFGIPIGYEFFPIKYKDKEYVVQMKFVLPPIGIDIKKPECIKLVCNVFKYDINKQLLRGHKRNLIYRTNDFSFVQIDEERILNIRETTEEEMKKYLPNIMKALFEKYEQYILERKKDDCIEQWNGVIH